MNAPEKPKAKAKFVWDDPLLLDAQLSEDERMVRDAARKYCQSKLLPRVLEAFRNESTDPKIFREMGELGLLGPTIPEEYGGPGLNYVSYGLIAREVERVDSGYRSMMSVQSSLVMLPIYEFDKYDVKPSYRALVENHAAWLRANPKARLVITGNTDEHGPSSYNLALGQRRAESVARMLVLLGAKPDQIEAVSFGKEKPRALGHDEASWAENRRADFGRP